MKKLVWVLGGILAVILLLAVAYGAKTFLPKFRAAPDNAPAVEQGKNNVPRLNETVVLDGLTNVWDVGFLPDGPALFTERAGTISTIADGKKSVLHAIGNIYAKGEGGLLGLVVDPKFTDNRYIYACYSTSQDIRVSRWQVSDKADSLDEQTDIVTGLPVNTRAFPGRHSGCRPRFGADDNLWIATGDSATGTVSQDPKSLGGKILRVNRNGGGVEGNLPRPFDNRIYSYGHRNIQGLAMYDQSKNSLYGYSVEHGPDKDDEINPLRMGNMGWDPVPLYNELVPMTDTNKYPDAIKPIWTTGSTTLAPSGMTFIRGSQWRSLEGRLAVAILKNKHLRILALNEDGAVQSEEVLFQNTYGRLRSAVMGPNNDLYLTTDNGMSQDKIIKVTAN